MDNRAIGIFDSGVGGLTVAKELIRCLPNEDIVYFGDTARVPYGTKSKQTIIRFSVENVLLLLRYNVKVIVVACNTSSSVALTKLRENFKVPIMDVISPGVSDAVSATGNNRIGIIGTSATVKSKAYQRQILKRLPCARVFSRGCPLFVPLVEEGWLTGRITSEIIGYHLMDLKKNRIDTLILGCTHYPLLRSGISKFMGKEVRLIDSAVSTARSVKRFLHEGGLTSGRPSAGRLSFLVSDEPAQFKSIGGKFLGRGLIKVRKASYGL